MGARERPSPPAPSPAAGEGQRDFYCEELKVAIEVDGGIHDNPEQRARDEVRQQILEDLAIRFIRVPAHLLNNDRVAVMQFLTQTLSTMKGNPLPSRERGRGEGRNSR